MSRTIYVVDDDPLSRRMLALELASLRAEPWPFAGGAQFLAMLPHLEPAPILIAGRAANMHGLPLLAEIAEKTPWPILLSGERGDFRTAYDAVKLGAVDFLATPVDGAELAEALAALAARLERSRRLGDAQRGADERLARLSPRELEVGLSLISGMGNKSVAHALGISVRTVEMHRARLLRKLGVRNIAEGAVLLSSAGAARRP